MMSNYEKFLIAKKAELEAMTYCCPTLRRLRIDAMGANINIDWDDKTMEPFGTYEVEGYRDCPPFQMVYCMFCGTKLK